MSCLQIPHEQLQIMNQ